MADGVHLYIRPEWLDLPLETLAVRLLARLPEAVRRFGTSGIAADVPAAPSSRLRSHASGES